jgi:hypothetical protein
LKHLSAERDQIRMRHLRSVEAVFGLPLDLMPNGIELALID